MPKLTQRVPKLCRHHKGQAFVKLEGRQHWLGPYGSDHAREAYDRLIAEWLANDRQLPPRRSQVDESALITVRQVIAEYWRTDWSQSALRTSLGPLNNCSIRSRSVCGTMAVCSAGRSMS